MDYPKTDLQTEQSFALAKYQLMIDKMPVADLRSLLISQMKEIYILRNNVIHLLGKQG